MIKFSLIKNICKSVSLIIYNNNETLLHTLNPKTNLSMKKNYILNHPLIYYIPLNDFTPTLMGGEIKIDLRTRTTPARMNIRSDGD